MVAKHNPKEDKARKAKKLSKTKAKKILADKTIRGKKLTKKQVKFFGAIAGGAKIRKKK